MSDRLVDRRDLHFLLFEMFEAERLCDHEYFQDHSSETFNMALDTAYQLSQELFWPAYQDFDRNPARFDGEKTTVPESMHRIWAAFKEGGWFAAGFPFEQDGQQFPGIIQLAAMYMFNAANTAAAMYVGQAIGAAHLVDSFASEKLKNRFLPKLLAGDWGGTMALTEPQAGTSLGDITTSATPVEGEDYYLIRGTKRFISSGDQDITENIIHPTLARIEGAPPGVKGISLFIVPKYRINEDGSSGESNDVLTAGIEHKLGLKGQATAELKYGENDQCRGWLLGEPNQGLKYMFLLMNTARVHTGVQAIAQASAAYQCALQYTQERVQGREVTEQDPTTPQIPIIKHAEVRRMLLRQKAYVEGVISLLMYCAVLSDRIRVADSPEEEENYHALLEILTPVCKAYGSDIAYESIMLALQCYGGSGYVEEFPIAQMLRDNRVFSVYEGTNEIQAMDLLGRKVATKQGAYLQILMAEVSKTLAEAGAIESLGDQTAKVQKALDAVVEVTMHLGAIGLSGDHRTYISHATPYLRAFSQLVIAWQFLWQSVLARRALDSGAGETAFYEGKIATAKYYIDAILPSTHTICELIKSGEDSALNFKDEWFGVTSPSMTG